MARPKKTFLEQVFNSNNVGKDIWIWILYVVALSGIANYYLTPEMNFHGLRDVDLKGMSGLGGLLSFLLVFRTNLSYGRFWEARGLVGGGIKTCRVIASQTCTYVNGGDASASAKRANILRLTRLSFSSIVETVHVDESPTRWSGWAAANGELLADEIKIVCAAPRPSLILLQMLRVAISDANQAKMIPDLIHMNMDANVNDMVACYNGLTKIDSTPVPAAFGQMCKLFILIFITVFPFALQKEIGHCSMILAPLSAYALFGLDHLSGEMMNPFGNGEDDLDMPGFVIGVATDTRFAENTRLGASAFPTNPATPSNSASSGNSNSALATPASVGGSML
jgi:putative membrane protein